MSACAAKAEQEKGKGVRTLSEKASICLVTSTRADWGLLRRVAGGIHASSRLALQLVATGAHLAPEFGNTVEEVAASGLPIAACLPVLPQQSVATGRDMAHTVARTIDVFTDYFEVHRPKAVLVLGDRYEIFAVGTAAGLAGIPLAHISGGDVTLGAVDEWCRHSLTKMASLHFPSCETYARRVIRMGEHPSTVENVGGLGDENLRKMPLLSRGELAASLGIPLREPFALVTYHPQTAGGLQTPQQQFEALVRALAAFPQLYVIFTKANADAGGAAINRCIDALCAKEPERCAAFASMGARRYLSAMRYCAAVIGNSSSGVVETPTWGVPAVNIGSRQAGRVICANVLCCGTAEAEIRAAIAEALTPEFRARAAQAASPYNGGDTAARIVRRLEQWVDSPAFGQPKAFFDAPAQYCEQEEAHV